ncbi:MAG TPA: TonB-dependent receptor [Caulobacteraceae bacterium]|nr:TonB-dependent receptor [Caulobacteraceae bacterium]
MTSAETGIHFRPRHGGWAAALAGAALLAPAGAWAQGPAVAFHVPAQPLGDALVEFGLQAGVSIGARDMALCGGGEARAVSGRLTVAEGLAQLLANAHCTFEAVDSRTYRIVRRAPAIAKRAPLAAEAAADRASDVVLDVTVTATKRPSLIERVPASVSTAPSVLLAAGRIDNLPDLAAEFAGVTSTNLGPGRNKVFVRGLSDGAFTGRTQSTVGLYLDDVPITYNAPDPDLRLVDVDRVELMRGPQGSLYGVGSIGGIIRIITRKPDLDAPAVGVALGGAVTRFGRPSTSLDAMMNVPLVPGRLALRGVVYHEDSGGYIDDVRLGINNVNRTQRLGGRVALAAALNGDWKLTTGLNYQRLNSDDSQYADQALPRLERANQVREPHDNDFAQAFATLEGGGGWGRLKVSTAFVAHDFTSRYDASLVLPLFGAPPGAGAFDDLNRVRQAVAEAVMTSPPGGRLQWLIGAFGSNAIQNSTLRLEALDPAVAGPLYLEHRRDHLGEVALYGEASYPLTSTLTATAGLRVFHSWLSTTSAVRQPASARDFSGKTETNDLSPKAVLSWQSSPASLFYILASEGYRVGGFNTSGRNGQLFTATSGRQPDRLFQPDQLWNFELGAKISLMGGRTQIRSALYYDDWRNIQSDQFLPSGLPYTANVGRGDNKGVEIEAEHRFDSHLDLRINLLANGPRLRDRDPTYPARRNASFPAVPQHSAAVVLDYTHALGGGLTAVLHGRVAYVGASILTLEEQNNQPMGDYVTGRLSAGVEAGGGRLTAFVDNPADSGGDTFAFGDPFSLGYVRQVTPLRPRTFGLTLAFGL